MNEDQARTLDQLDAKFGSGSRDVYFGITVGMGAYRIMNALIARRAAAGERCLVVSQSPRIRIEDLKRDEPALDVGRLGSGAMVEVTNYPTAGHRIAKGDTSFGADRDFLLMEDASAEPSSDRILAIRKAMDRVPVLVQGPAPSRNPYPLMDAQVMQVPPDAMKSVMAKFVTVKPHDVSRAFGGPRGGGMSDAAPGAFATLKR